MVKSNTVRNRLLMSTVLTVGLGFSLQANAEIWQDLQETRTEQKLSLHSSKAQIPTVNRARKIKLNATELRFVLNQAPNEIRGHSQTYIDLPLPNGKMGRYKLYQSPVMNESLAREYPNIQTFRVVDTRNPENTGRLDMGPEGFHGMLFQNGDTIFIDPIGNNQYQSYYKTDYAAELSSEKRPKMNCQSQPHIEKAKNMSPIDKFAYRAQKTDISYGTHLRTYRLAVAATGEFTAFHGGTKEKAMSAIVTGINRVNQIYETDLAIKLELVANNSSIVFVDASSDPFTDNNPDSLIEEVGKVINDKIGLSNYDVGHIFSTGGGGIAGFGVVCGEAKAEGVTGTDSPINDPFFIDFVAHELGHQFQADHTFNGTAEGCDGNRGDSAAYEPGSGSTIMGYANLCGEEDLQSQSDAYFHTHSLTEISRFVSDSSTGGSCGVSKHLNNTAPIPIAGEAGYIPKSTPFILTGSATDANAADKLSYTWEQYDLGPATSSKESLVDDGKRPLFRSFPPSNSPTRMFPKIGDVISGTTTYGEVLPTQTRDMNFRFTVRDGKGGVAAQTRKISVDAKAGPFVVTAPDAVSWASNSTETISWDVANTTAAPINCANVEIALSTNGGRNFSTIIKASTPNDGSETITVPNQSTSQARIRVMCKSQPFFAISKTNFTIRGSGSSSGTNSIPIANFDRFTVQQDSSATRLAVLDNDSDNDGDTLTITDISQINNGGTATINGTHINYQPKAGFNGTETFTYTISDGKGGTASAQVSVIVKASSISNNTPPVANDDSYSVAQDSFPTNFNVLNNDRDAEGQSLTITSVSHISNGASVNINGSQISYEPALGFSGTETFTYAISDGEGGTDSAKVSVVVKATATTGSNSGGGSTGGNVPVTSNATSGGGGGSFGLFTLLLLNLGRSMKRARLRRAKKNLTSTNSIVSQ